MTDVLAALGVMLPAAAIGGFLARKAGQPAVLGELLAGVLVGNAAAAMGRDLTWLVSSGAVETLAQCGVLVLLFETGLETTVGQMLRVGATALRVAVLGIIGPLLAGWAVGAWLLPDSTTSIHVFLGAILTATSVGITARVFKDLQRSNSPEARIILGASVIDDALGLLILAAAVGLIGITSGERVVSPTASALVLLKASAPPLGAFAAGLAIDKRRVEGVVRPAALVLVPIFFVLMGLRTDLSVFTQSGIFGLTAAFTAAAVAGKQICAFGVPQGDADRLSVGIGMIPRGEVGLIFANIGATLFVDGRPIVDAGIFSAVVAMVVVTTVLTPPALKWSLSRATKLRRT